MSKLPTFLTVIVAVIASFITFFIRSDYWLEGIILIYIFYILRHDLNMKCFLAIIVTFISTIEKYYGAGVLAIFFIFFYDGTKGQLDLKRIHYLFYPLHIALLYGALYISNIYN